MSAYRTHRAHPRLHVLEDRLAPAVAALVGGTLQIDYTAAAAVAENLTAGNDGTNIVLSVDVAGLTSFPTAPVSRIVVADLGGGSAQSLVLAGPTSYLLPGGFSSTGVDDVTIKADVATQGAAFSISALNNTTISAAITTSGGALSLIADSDGDGNGTLTISGQTLAGWSQQGRLIASDGKANDELETVVISADGNTAFVGNPFTNQAAGLFGKAYAFTRQGSNWVQQQIIENPDPATLGAFGWTLAVSADGNTAAIGARFNGPTQTESPGAVYDYTRTATTWALQQKLTPNNIGVDDIFGMTMSLSADGNVALIGSPGRNAGFVFSRTCSAWTQQQEIELPPPSGPNLACLTTLSADGHTVIVGRELHDSVYIFTQTAGAWGLSQTLTVPLVSGIALSGDGAALVAGSRSGEAYYYSRFANTWQLLQLFANPESATGDGFGKSVAISEKRRDRPDRRADSDDQRSQRGGPHILADAHRLGPLKASVPQRRAGPRAVRVRRRPVGRRPHGDGGCPIRFSRHQRESVF